MNMMCEIMRFSSHRAVSRLHDLHELSLISACILLKNGPNLLATEQTEAFMALSWIENVLEGQPLNKIISDILHCGETADVFIIRRHFIPIFTERVCEMGIPS